LLSSAEMEVFLQGFADGMNNRVADEVSLLEKYGEKLNQILTSRIAEVQKGQQEKTQFVVDGFMKSNPQAVQTSSGLVYSETKAGTGAQPTVENTVEVSLQRILLAELCGD
jgi:FKBP-type peptidyl-prolyl cis-trans isomerase